MSEFLSSTAGKLTLVAVVGVVAGILGSQVHLGGGHAVSVGYVDVQKVFEGSSRGKVQIAAFQEEITKRSTVVKNLSEQVEAMKQEIEGLAKNGNRYEAQQKLPAFQQAQQQLLQAQQLANQELQNAQAEVDKAFMNQLKTVTDTIRKDESLDILQAYDANKTLSYDPTLDFTQKALLKYNEAYPADADSTKLPTKAEEPKETEKDAKSDKDSKG